MTSPTARRIIERDMPWATIVDLPMTPAGLVAKYGGSPETIAQNVGLMKKTGSELVTVQVPLAQGQPKSLGRRTLVVNLDEDAIVGSSG